MLQTTLELIAHLQQQTSKRNATVIRTLVAAIVKCGGREDAQALLDSFKTAPFDFDHSCLFPVFEKYGDARLAEQIFRLCFQNNQLTEACSPEVLALLGQLKYEPVKPVLIRYAFTSADHSLSKYAVLGLLHFDCRELEEVIVNAIEQTYDKNLFPEFVPALVCKLSDRKNMLAKLYESGTTVCSTDCNAGIILGFSLCGPEGVRYFRKVLFDPAWEVYAAGTGTIYYTYQGMKHSGITFHDLYLEVKQLEDKEQLAYGLRVLFSLLEVKIKDDFSLHPESFSAVYLSLFGQENDTLTDLSRLVNLSEEAWKLEALLELKMHEETLLRSCISRQRD